MHINWDFQANTGFLLHFVQPRPAFLSKNPTHIPHIHSTMPIQLISRDEQASGQFNGGAILENKPIGFPGEGGHIRPYSNLFYWAHAWSDGGSTIGEHPHQGFEIMSFVMKGDIEHYDSHYRVWKKLKAGDAQIIRAGKGISHAEKLNAGSHIFQIWVDPNLRKTLEQPASYDDYESADFPVTEQAGYREKSYSGPGAPMTMDTPGMKIKEITFLGGTATIPMEAEHVHSVYVWNGSPQINGQSLSAHDFLIAQDEAELTVEADENDRIFMIVSPVAPGYSTYAQMRGMA